MRFSMFADAGGQHLTAQDMDWWYIVAQCLAPTEYNSKAECPLIKLASFGNTRSLKNSLRHGQNMLTVSGVEIDYDAEQLSIHDAHAVLSAFGIRCVLYTSPSHTSATPRWRILAPMSKEFEVEHRREFVGRINCILGGVCASESYVAAQSFYFGKVIGREYECLVVDGEFIDRHVNIPAIYPERNSILIPSDVTATEYAPNDGEAVAMERIENTMRSDKYANRHMARFVAGELAGGYIAGGVTEPNATYEMLQRVSDDISDYSETPYGEWQTIMDGVAKGMTAPLTSPRKPLDISSIGFGVQAVPAPPSGTPVAPNATMVQPVARLVVGSRLVSPQQQMEHLFQGCVYIGSENKILIPGGWLLDRQRFDNMTGGFSFIMNNENQGSPSKSAWEAFTLNQAYDSPRAETTCFRPELPPGVIVREGGQRAANTWWPIDTVRTPGDVTPFLDYMRRVLPDERDRLLLTSYLAAMVQYPGVKFQWCPVVQGAKGNGKTLIGTSIERALGDRYCHRPNSADIGNKFTGWLRGKLAVIVEELSTHEKRELLETLKPLITNRRVEIQNKGADQSTGDNRANFIMFVNGKGDMPIDENERRYGLFHMAQQEYADIVRDGMGGEYFPNLFRWADSGGYECISHYLATFAIPDEMNPAGKLHRAPRTSSTDDAIAHSLGPMEQELLEVIEGNVMPGMMNGWLSGAAVKKAMTEAGRKTSPQSRARCLKALGYVLHPHLPEGRSPAITFVDGCRPKLYVRAGSDLCQIEPVAAVIAAYLAAQVSR